MRDVYVAGVAMTKFGPQVDLSLKDLVIQAVDEVGQDGGLEPGQVEMAFFSNALQGVVEGQVSLSGQVAMRAAGLTGVPIVNVENACASGSTAFWLAVQQIRGGLADVVLAVGAEKMCFDNPKQRQLVMDAFAGGVDLDNVQGDMDRIAVEARGVEGPSGDGHRTMFMDLYANVTRAHMAKFGTTQEQLAVIASKNHAHAALNDRCHYNKPMSVDEILTGRPLAYPLTVPMCSPFSDGAAAVIVCSRAGLERLSRQRPQVKVLACELGSATEREWSDVDNHLVSRLARQAYEVSSLEPGDMHLAEVHDATAFGELFMSELLGLCPVGEGGSFAESGATALGGRVPINPSGGLESKGHPIGASGLAQIFELVTQLRGEAGDRQVHGARNAIHENGGGFIGVEEGAAVITILTNSPTS